MQVPSKHILFTVLDWGLGHATRSVPVIEELLRRGMRISLAGEGYSLDLLKRQFPELPSFPLKGIQVRSKHREPTPMWLLRIAMTMPGQIRNEHKQLIALCEQLRPDAIISDNRYGAWHPNIPSVLICHQLNLPTHGIVEPLVQALYRPYLNRFSECWIPDVHGNDGLSGKLSQGRLRGPKIVHIGILSRLQKGAKDVDRDGYDLLILLSGPEPQRSFLEQKLLAELSSKNLRVVMFPGRHPIESDRQLPESIHVRCNPGTDELSFQLNTARYIVCRPGYSSLMDLARLNRPARCIPTPGQPEQQYLGALHSNKKRIELRQQHEPGLLDHLESLDECAPWPDTQSHLLSETIDRFLKFI